MNEFLFFSHILFSLCLTILAARMGKVVLAFCYGFLVVFANVLVNKQMELFGLTVTCVDVYSISCFFSLNLMQEIFSKEDAKQTMRISYFALIVTCVMLFFHLRYIPSIHDTTQDALLQLFSSTPRIITVSAIVALSMQRLNIELYGSLRKKFPSLSITVVNIIALVTTQTLDTFLFTYIALWGLMHSLFQIFFVSLIVKLVVIACMTPLTSFAKRIASHV